MRVSQRQWAVAGVTVFSLALLGGAIGAAPILALENPDNNLREKRNTAQISEQEKRLQSQLKLEEKHQVKQLRLEGSRLKSCQKREKVITSKMARISDRGTRQLEVFNKISERTQAFYAEKGRTLSNYQILVDDVNAKKTAAEAVLAKIKTGSQEFKCDSEDPKGSASSFKANLKTEIAALKDYKTAVKSLIVGVKSVQATPEPSTSTGGN